VHDGATHVSVCAATDAVDIVARKEFENRQHRAMLMYYVHYVEAPYTDKRFDTWVPEAMLMPAYDAVLPSPRSVSPTIPTRMATRELKAQSQSPADLSLLTMDEQTAEKNFQEMTKVKTINVVELGRWGEIATW
jgi:hypothetical protein